VPDVELTTPGALLADPALLAELVGLAEPAGRPGSGCADTFRVMPQASAAPATAATTMFE
jgi:hypothetical protein